MLEHLKAIQNFALLEDYFFCALSSTQYTVAEKSKVYLTDIELSNFRMFLQRCECKQPKTLIKNVQELFTRNQISHWAYVVPEHFHTPNLVNALQEMGFNFSEQSTAMYFELTQSNELFSQDLVIKNVKADNHQWLDIVQKAFGGSDTTNQQDSDALMAAANQINVEHFIGLKNGQPVAAITLTFQDDYARIDNVATHLDYQRLGYASQMVQFCMELAASKASRSVFLEASSKGLGLYKRLGFVEIFKNYIYEWEQ